MWYLSRDEMEKGRVGTSKDVRMHGCTDVQRDEIMDAWMYGCMDGSMDVRMYGFT